MARKLQGDDSVLNRLFSNKRIAQQVEESVKERRERLLTEGKAIDAKSKRDIRAYGTPDPDQMTRVPDLSHDDRDLIVKRAASVVRDRVTDYVGKGGFDMKLEEMKVLAARDDIADEHGEFVERALLAFKLDFQTPTKPMQVYAAVDFDQEREKPDRFKIEPRLFTTAGQEVPFTRQAMRDMLDQGEIRQATYKQDRKLVIFDMSHEDPRFHRYAELPVKDVEMARSKLEGFGIKTARKRLGPEHGLEGPVYEVMALSDAYPMIRKVLAQEWTEFSKKPKNDEGKAWSNASEEAKDWAGRSREKDPTPWSGKTDRATDAPVKEDEGRAWSEDSEKVDRFPGRAHEKNTEWLDDRDVDRSVKNDEFDGNHMTDERTERVSEWPGRTHEGNPGKAASPEQMLRFEQRRQAQGAPYVGGGAPNPTGAPAPQGNADDQGALPGSSDETGSAGAATGFTANPAAASEGSPGASPEQAMQQAQQTGQNVAVIMKPDGTVIYPQQLPAAQAAKKIIAASRRFAQEMMMDDGGEAVEAMGMAPMAGEDEMGGDPLVEACDRLMSCLEMVDDPECKSKLEAVCKILQAVSDEPDVCRECVTLLEDCCDAIADPDCRSACEAVKSACQDVCGDVGMEGDLAGGDGKEGMGMSCGLDKPGGMMRFTEEDEEDDDPLGLLEEKPEKSKPPFKSEDDDDDDDEEEDDDDDDDSIVTKAHRLGRRVARYFDYLSQQGYKVQARCYCPGNRICGEVGCSSNKDCNTFRGIHLMQMAAEKNKPGTEAEMMSAKSHPSPEGFPAPDSMDGLDGLGDVEPQVVPSERGKAESQVRRSQKHDASGFTGQPSQPQGVLPIGGKPAIQQQGNPPALQGKQVWCEQEGRMMPKEEYEKKYGKSAYGRHNRQAITNTGTDNDPPDKSEIPLMHRDMDGMQVQRGDQAPHVVPSETSEARECVVPGINKNPDQNVTDDSEREPCDGVGPRPKFTPPTNKGATTHGGDVKHEWTGKKEGQVKIKDQLKKQLSSGAQAPRPTGFHRTVAKKNKKREAALKKADKVYQSKRLAILEDWRMDLFDLDECNRRMAALTEEYSAAKKKLASDMGRERAKGGEMSQFERSRDKYHQSETLKNRSEFKDQDWWERSREKMPYKGGSESHNLHPSLKGDEGKERSDETEDAKKWPGRSREKADDETVKKMPEIDQDSKSLKVKEDEGKAWGKDSEDPTKFPGRTREKRTKAPSKDVGKHMYREESLRRGSDDKLPFLDDDEDDTDDEKSEDNKSKKSKGDKKEAPAWMKNAAEMGNPPQSQQKCDCGGELKIDRSVPGQQYKCAKCNKTVKHLAAQKVPGGGPDTSYVDDGKADIATDMPPWEYGMDEEKGRSDQAQDTPSPLHRSENVDETFYSDGKYLKKDTASSTATRKIDEQSKIIDAYKKYRKAGGHKDFQEFKKKAAGKSLCSQCKKMKGVDQFKRGAKMCSGCMARKAQSVDQQRVPADIRRHHIDQQTGAVNHLGHPFKGNDVVFAPNDRVYQDLQEGRQPNSLSPYSNEYFAEMALRGMEGGIYWNGNEAFKGVTGAEEARFMNASQKMRVAELIRASGIWVDDNVVKEVITRGNEMEQQLRGYAGDK